MKKLKVIKKTFNSKELKIYKKKFSNKQVRFAFSKVALIFYPNIDTKKLINEEQNIFRKEKTSDMFIESFQHLTKLDKKIDWKSFGKLMWYSFQTSTYWKDLKNNIKNIFNKKNYIKKNEEKRSLYYKWLKSVPRDIENYNKKIIEVMKVIF